jgi:DNA-binding LytR/AlgR family response regulator
MDINMPRMNGIQATNVIKKSRKETAIIGLCVVHDPYTIEAFLKAGGLERIVSRILKQAERLTQSSRQPKPLHFPIHSVLRRPCKHDRLTPMKGGVRCLARPFRLYYANAVAKLTDAQRVQSNGKPALT